MKKNLLAAVAVLALLCGATKSAHAVYDGTPSTGSFTIATNASLAAASATGNITIVSTTGLKGQMATVGAYQFVAGRDFSVGATISATATNLAAAINASNAPVTAVANSAEVDLTGDAPGTLYNGVALKTSLTDVMTVSAATLTGGLDNAYVSINGVKLTQGTDWFVMDVASNTASNLAASINLNGSISPLVRAAWVGGSSAVVYLRSIRTPVAYILSTSGSVITKSQAAMSGGAAGNITPKPCYLGAVNTIPTSNYPAGCLAFLISNPNVIYLSTEAVVGTQSWMKSSSTAWTLY